MENGSERVWGRSSARGLALGLGGPRVRLWAKVKAYLLDVGSECGSARAWARLSAQGLVLWSVGASAQRSVLLMAWPRAAVSGHGTERASVRSMVFQSWVAKLAPTRACCSGMG